MVSIEEIQAAYYMVAATGVLVAAGYYIINMRATQKNMSLTLESRRIAITLELIKGIREVDTTNAFCELMNWEWLDYDDYYKKYGSNPNAEAAGKMYNMFNRYNSYGAMIRKGMLGVEDLYDSNGQGVVYLWEKFKPIVEEVRRRYNGRSYMMDFEFCACEMLRYVKTRDPSYNLPETLTRYVPDK
jgi:hypothetical protein